MRTIIINGEEKKIKATALLPRLYRFNFGRDLVQEMYALEKRYKKVIAEMKETNPDATEEEIAMAQYAETDITLFENLAWLMLRSAGEDVGNRPEEWLDSMDGPFSIYEYIPVIFAEWLDGVKTTSTP